MTKKRKSILCRIMQAEDKLRKAPAENGPWSPKIGETYVVRGRDNSEGGQLLGFIKVKKINNVRAYSKSANPSLRYTASVEGPYYDAGSYKYYANGSWSIGPAGLVPDNIP